MAALAAEVLANSWGTNLVKRLVADGGGRRGPTPLPASGDLPYGMPEDAAGAWPRRTLGVLTALDSTAGAHAAGRYPARYRETMTDEPWPKRPWLAVIPTRAPSTWRPVGPAPQLPDQLAHLGDGLGRDGLAEAGQPTAGVDRDAAAQGRVAVAEELLRLALLAQADVLVPVELEGGRQVVDLGQVDVLGADAGLLVGGQGHRLLERRAHRGGGHRRVGREVGHLDDGLGEPGRDRRHGVDGHQVLAGPACLLANSVEHSTRAAPPSEVAQISSRRSGSATMGEARTSSAVTSLRYRA